MSNLTPPKNILITVFALIFIAFASCKKEAGEGGRATIKGKLIVVDYDATYTIAKDTFVAQGENVYIIYGDEKIVGDNVKTSYDGTFEFQYLRKGKYKIYAISADSSAKISNKTIEVLKEVNITEKKQVLTLDDIVIID